MTKLKSEFLAKYHNETGIKSVTLAFALGSRSGCEPAWGGELPIDEPTILENIKEFQELGGEVILATGGAMGPYLENSCSTSRKLANAYEKALKIIGTNHLDIDIGMSIVLCCRGVKYSTTSNHFRGSSQSRFDDQSTEKIASTTIESDHFIHHDGPR